MLCIVCLREATVYCGSCFHLEVGFSVVQELSVITSTQMITFLFCNIINNYLYLYYMSIENLHHIYIIYLNYF